MLNEDCILCQALTVPILQKVSSSWSGVDARTVDIENSGPFYKERLSRSAVKTFRQSLVCVREVHGRRTVKCKFRLAFYVGGKRKTEDNILVPLKLYYRSPFGGLRRVKPWKCPRIDVRSLRRAISSCESTHDIPCQPEGSASPDGVRFIDTHELKIFRPAPAADVQFIALSYVCAAVTQEFCRKLSVINPLDFETPGALKQEDYPRLIWDAIALCQELGQRYLWIDCLCIIQDDDNEMIKQIQAMDRIYANAWLTLVVAADFTRDVGIPGIRTRPRRTWWEEQLSDGTSLRLLDFNFMSDIENSIWNTRGWTFQERCLSRRKVFISNYRSFFSCKEMDFQENRGRRNLAAEDFDVHYGPPTMWLGCFDDYMVAVEDYTCRKLTFESDALRAFAGYSNVVAKQLDTRMLFGMPERYMSRALYFECGDIPRRRQGVTDTPSWSWAAWSGMADFEPTMGYLDRHGFGCLVVIYYVDPEQGFTELMEEDWWYFDEDYAADEQPCDHVIEPPEDSDYESWPRRPSHNWEQCPHNRASLDDHLDLDGTVFATLEQFSRCLIFNTTIAKVSLEATITVPGGVIKTEDITIHNDAGLLTGVVSKGTNQPVPQWVDTSKQYEIIVIGAGVLNASIRDSILVKDQLASRLPGLWLETPNGEKRSPWVLHIMVVKRQQAKGRILERLGIGFVLMELWKECKPEWETVVLA